MHSAGKRAGAAGGSGGGVGVFAWQRLPIRESGPLLTDS